MSSRAHLDEQGILEEEKKYLDAQRRFNETGDREILFYEMVPYLEQAIESNLVNMTNGKRTAFEYKNAAEDAALMIAKRYVKGLKNGVPYSKDKPRTLAYWGAMMMNRTYRDRWLSPVVYDKINVEDLDKETGYIDEDIEAIE